MKLTFLSPTLGLALGIFSASLVSQSYWLAAIAIGLALLIWLTIYIESKHPLKSKKYSSFHFLWIGVLFFGIGAIDFDVTTRMSVNEDIPGKQLSITGRVTKTSSPTSGDQYFLHVVSLHDENGKEIPCKNLGMLLSTDGYIASVGDLVHYKSKIYEFANDSPKKKNYADFMRHNGIYYKTYANSDKIQKLGFVNSFVSFCDRINRNIVIKIEKSSLNKSSSDFIISILLGDKAFLRSSTKDTLSSAGLAHILALSGLHVGIVFGLFLIILYPLKFTRLSKWSKLLAILMVWIYVFISGSAPSTVRAAIMATLVICAFFLQRKNSSLNSLLVAAFLILLFSPSSLWNPGFQLSFLGVAAILIFSDRLNPVDHHAHPRLFKIINAVIISLVTTLVTCTLVAYYFNFLPMMFLPANLLLLPLFPLLVGSSLIYVLLLFCNIDFHLCARFIEYFIDLFVKASGLLSNSGNSNISIAPDLSSVILWFMGIALAAFSLWCAKRSKKLIYASISALFIFFSIFMIMNPVEYQYPTYLNFPHSFSSMKAELINGDTRQKIEFPPYNISHAQYRDVRFIAVDAVLKPEFSDAVIKDSENKTFLIVGPRADLQQVASIVNSLSIEKIILHPNLGKNQQAEFIELLDDMHHDKIHAMRDMGSLKLEIP